MEIRFLGHASFLIVSSKGTRILLDPYEPGSFDGAVGHSAFKEKVDVVVSSHRHVDHYYISPDFGTPAVITETGEAKSIMFKAIPMPHDDQGGKLRGMVNMFRFEIDDISLCHSGDVGDKIIREKIDQLKKIDVLFLPVGGTYTIGPEEAGYLADQVNPRLIIPMHYKTKKIQFPLKPVDDFLKNKQNVKFIKSGRITITKETLPEKREIWVMEPEL